MVNSGKPKKFSRRLLGLLFSVISLAVLAYLAVTLISGGDLGLHRLSGLVTPRTRLELVDEFDFDVGRERVFADLGDAVASVGTLGVQVLDFGGNESLRVPFRLSRPAVSVAGSRAVAFDIGGTEVLVFDESQVLASVEPSGAVISASINRNGWFCVSTQGFGGYRGFTTVYNNLGVGRYRVSLTTGYTLSAVLSDNNNYLAVLSLTDDGSRVSLYHGLSDDEPDHEFTLNDSLILDMFYLPNHYLLVITTDLLIKLNRQGVPTIVYDFNDKRLGGYVLDNDFIALYLLDYGVGYSGRLLSLDVEGEVLGEVATAREVISLSVGGGFLSVLKSDGLLFYNKALDEFSTAGEHISTAGASRVLSLRNGSAIASSDNSALLFSVER